ncbi:MAG TPA: DinB family protein [Chryseolinea sp.]|nr:DinB family protein [Chryseolinea sp.]
MKRLEWFERKFTFGLPTGMLPFYLERLEGTLNRIESKVKGVSEEVLSQKLDNKWSVKQNIGHLAEVDEIAIKRIGEMVRGVSPMSPAVFEPRGDYNQQSVEEVIAYFRKTRDTNVKRYGELTSDELERSSLHPRLKVNMTPVDLAWFDAEHDDHHLVRISEIISLMTKKN